jgi:P27 family predicted phage terminase small subunit
MKGRKPLPTQLKAIEGNRGKRPLPQNEPKPAPIMPGMPDWLDEIAIQEWQRLAPSLIRLGLLTEIDYIPFAVLVQEYSDMIQLRRYIAEHGRTYEHSNVKGNANETTRPEVYMLQKCIQNIKAFCVEFGLTASSRGRIQVPGMDDNRDDIDMFLSK